MKKIKGFPDYLITKDGRVFSKRSNRFLKGNVHPTGYIQVSIRNDSVVTVKFVHKLVAEAYLGHLPCGHNEVVDHIDNNKENNSLCNLQLITNRENLSKDKWRKSPSSKYTGVSYKKQTRKWQSHIRVNGKLKHLGYFNCEMAAAKKYQEELSKLEK